MAERLRNTEAIFLVHYTLNTLTDKQTHTSKQFSVSSSPDLCAFGLWEETQANAREEGHFKAMPRKDEDCGLSLGAVRQQLELQSHYVARQNNSGAKAQRQVAGGKSNHITNLRLILDAAMTFGKYIIARAAVYHLRKKLQHQWFLVLIRCL